MMRFSASLRSTKALATTLPPPLNPSSPSHSHPRCHPHGPEIKTPTIHNILIPPLHLVPFSLFLLLPHDPKLFFYPPPPYPQPPNLADYTHPFLLRSPLYRAPPHPGLSSTASICSSDAFSQDTFTAPSHPKLIAFYFQRALIFKWFPSLSIFNLPSPLCFLPLTTFRYPMTFCLVLPARCPFSLPLSPDLTKSLDPNHYQLPRLSIIIPSMHTRPRNGEKTYQSILPLSLPRE